MAVALTSCIRTPLPPRLGVVTQITNEPPCATFTGPELPVGTPIAIEAFEPRRTIAARVRSTHASCRDSVDLAGPAYTLSVPDGTTDLGIAIAAATNTNLTFRRCASFEGVHLTAWSGAHRVWHEYYHLDYDTDPTCTAEETVDP